MPGISFVVLFKVFCQFFRCKNEVRNYDRIKTTLNVC